MPRDGRAVPGASGGQWGLGEGRGCSTRARRPTSASQDHRLRRDELCPAHQHRPLPALDSGSEQVLDHGLVVRDHHLPHRCEDGGVRCRRHPRQTRVRLRSMRGGEMKGDDQAGGGEDGASSRHRLETPGGAPRDPGGARRAWAGWAFAVSYGWRTSRSRFARVKTGRSWNCGVSPMARGRIISTSPPLATPSSCGVM